MSDNEDDYEDMSKLKEASDCEKVEYIVGKLLVTRRALSAQSN